ncbi:MAG TPA: TonB-dependent receptor [Steroidobacteraceae bacterium]|nr:TonB-dependent receptor [Steroidobacteraceae bacterium]
MARTLLVGALVCLALALASAAGAQDPRNDPATRKEYSLNIDKQELTEALEQLYDQTGVFYGYSPETKEEEQKVVGPLKGKFTIEQALTELLQSTGLTYAWTNSKTISIVRAPPPPRKPSAAPPAKTPRNAQVSARRATAQEELQDDLLYTVITERQRFRLLDDGVAPIVLLDREAIERSGVTSISDLLKYVPQQPYLRPDGARSSGAQYAELRGLGADTTLVLITGHRAFASASSFVVNAFDLNTIPLSAVERVELKFDSTSVQHGMDAIGGVLNIVLRDEIRRPGLQVHYGSAEGGGSQVQTAASIGYVRDTVRGALMLDYSSTQPLLGDQRALWADQDYRRYGSIDQRSVNSSPGNVTGLPQLGNLPGLSSPIAAIPETIAGDHTALSEFIPGQRNYESLLQYNPIVPATTRASVVANGQVQLVPTDLVASAELIFVDRSVRAPTAPPLVPGLPVPMTNPFNPFHVPVFVNNLLEGMARQEQNVDSTLTRGTASLHAKTATWDWDLSLLRSEEDAELRLENTVDFARLMQVLANPDPSQTLDLFRPGPAASQEILDSLVAPPIVNRYAVDATQVSGFASGRVMELPGGLLTALIGGEWRKESAQFFPAVDSFEREVGSGFVELKMPIVGTDMHVPALRELTLTAGGRLDKYSDFGQIFNPQFGLRWLPYKDLALHASLGRSFRAPSMYELYLPRQASLPIFQVTDPRRGGATSTVSLLTGGNAELDPTRGKSLTAGLVFTPEAVPPLEVFARYWHVTMDNRITLLQPSLVLANEDLFPERVIRGAPTAVDVAAGLPGAVTQIDISRMNFGGLTTSGIDLGLRYEFESSFGELAANAVATWIGEYETIDVPATPAVDRVNLANEVGTITKWRAVGGLDWDRGPVSATMHVRYIPSYDDTRGGVRNGRHIGAQTFVDLQTAFDLGGLDRNSAFLRGTEITAGASNLLDEQPQFAEVAGAVGYDMSQGDLKGRFWYVRLGKTF